MSSGIAFDKYTKQQILFFYFKGYRSPTISKLLEDEGIFISRRGVATFIICYLATRSIAQRPGSGRRTKITKDVKRAVEEQMKVNDKMRTTQLHVPLVYLGYSLSLHTILRCRSTLGWTFHGSAYSQLIREANRIKRLEWACKHKDDDINNVLFTDETIVQQESHCRFCCRKKGESPKSKPRYFTHMYVYQNVHNN